MNTLRTTHTGVENLTKVSRLIRGVFGAALIAFVLTTPAAPIGWYMVLPLLAVYPIFTAITGWDPIKALFQHPGFARRALRFSKPVRIGMGAIGVALIGSVYVTAYYGSALGLLAILPIVGIYPLMAAIIGMDPVTALFNLDNALLETKQAGKETTAKEQRPVVYGVLEGGKPAAGRTQDNHWKAA